MGGKEIYQFFSYLATDKKVVASTKNQPLNSLGFLYKHVSGIKLGDFRICQRARKPEGLPTVLTKTVEYE